MIGDPAVRHLIDPVKAFDHSFIVRNSLIRFRDILLQHPIFLFPLRNKQWTYNRLGENELRRSYIQRVLSAYIRQFLRLLVAVNTSQIVETSVQAAPVDDDMKQCYAQRDQAKPYM